VLYSKHFIRLAFSLVARKPDRNSVKRLDYTRPKISKLAEAAGAVIRGANRDSFLRAGSVVEIAVSTAKRERGRDTLIVRREVRIPTTFNGHGPELR
jgi:hypothetical protein